MISGSVNRKLSAVRLISSYSLYPTYSQQAFQLVVRSKVVAESTCEVTHLTSTKHARFRSAAFWWGICWSGILSPVPVFDVWCKLFAVSLVPCQVERIHCLKKTKKEKTRYEKLKQIWVDGSSCSCQFSQNKVLPWVWFSFVKVGKACFAPSFGIWILYERAWGT